MKRTVLIVILLFILVSAPRLVQANVHPTTKFGMFYLIWHCIAQTNIYDNTKILNGTGTWGPIPEFHWWDEPAAGYYCLSNNDALLRAHAEKLRDMGIDFVYVDITNNPTTYQGPTSDKPDIGIMNPFRRLLAVWSTVPNAPKIVPWVPALPNSDMVDWVSARMDEYPGMKFQYQGKPLLMIVNNPWFPADENRINTLSQIYTIRKAWGLGYLSNVNWSFLNQCTQGFLLSHGTQLCQQQMFTRNGTVEQIPVAPAYQETYESKITTAVPKFYGRTLRKQFETIFHNPDIPIVTIASFNEWIGQRMCLDANENPIAVGCTTANDHFPDGHKVFVDTYNQEYNRDIENSKNDTGSLYEDIVKDAISLYRSGNTCSSTSTNLYCRDTLAWEFGNTLFPSTDGLNGLNNLSQFVAQNGLITTSVTGPDPYFFSPDALMHPANSHDEIAIRMKITGGPLSAGTIFWVTDQSPGYDVAKTHNFSLIADNEWHTYTIPVGSNPLWSGTIHQIRIDLGTNNTGQDFSLDWIRMGYVFGIPTASEPSPTPTPIPGDLTGDKKVTILDYQYFISHIISLRLFDLAKTIFSYGK